MKKFLYSIFIIGLMFVNGFTVFAASTANSTWYAQKNFPDYVQVDTELRAVWVATVSNIDIAKQTGTSESDIKAWQDQYLAILDKAEAYHLNAIVFQIRPCNDAFYPSKYNPWSQFLYLYGKDPGWDPLAWMIEVTHERGMEYHAWLNPYRASVDTNISIASNSAILKYDNDALQAEKQAKFNNLKASCDTNIDNPAFATGEELEHNVVLGTEGKYVLNPASSNTIEHLVKTIEEIVENYEIDGIHFDDYFYPDDRSYVASSGSNAELIGTTFSTEPLVDYQDYQAYLKSGGSLDIYDWRRDNVNKLIETLSTLIRNLNKTKSRPCAFGISPCSRWAPTIEACPAAPNRGTEGGMAGSCYDYYSYADLYADTKKWVEEEWIDYILPQTYMRLTSTYTSVMEWWSDVVKPTSVKLYSGLALYLFDTWKSSDEIAYDVMYNQGKDNQTTGYVLYNYSSMDKTYTQLSLNHVLETCWQTNALTPVYEAYDYQHDVTSLAKVSKIEQISEEKMCLTYDTIKDAKAYALYQFTKDETNILPLAKNLAQMNIGSKNSTFNIDDYNPDNIYYLATISYDNTIYLASDPIDFTKAVRNNLPQIELASYMSDEVLVEKTLVVKFKITDADNDNLSYKVYLLYRERLLEISDTTFLDDILEVRWEAFAIEESDLQLVIKASDGKEEATFTTPKFAVVTTCHHNFQDATCTQPKICIKCGFEEGAPLGHIWQEADKTHPKTCKVCGLTEGEPLQGCSKCQKNNVITLILLISTFTSSLYILRKRGK